MPEPIDMGELVRETVAHFSRIRSGGPIDVQAAAGLAGCWDRLRLEQILTTCCPTP